MAPRVTRKPEPPAEPRGYEPLARRYRPRRFEDVVGQEAVGRTLLRALAEGRIASAFLFAGPRGVGKTTMARILAAALDCEQPADRKDPNPCGECGTCREIAAGSALDVIEVDAASHNSVEDVREIRERAASLPARARHKVYILDEAHMLSTAAWNALLKTLEEPPPHARFIFATTEPEKFPETVVSRCQRFDFRRIPAAAIVKKLAEIAEVEGIRVSGPALETLARFSRGGLRDAESLLEQAALAREGREVAEEDLAALLGAVPGEKVRGVLDRAASGDPKGTLEAYAAIYASGGDASVFLGQALETLREATALLVAGDVRGLVDAGDAERAALLDLGRKLGKAGALRATQALAETLRLVRVTDEERPLVEAGLLRIALAGEARTAGEVMEALAEMERRLGGPGTEGTAPAAEPRAGIGEGSEPPAGRAALFDTRPLEGAVKNEDAGLLTLDGVRREWPRILDEARKRVAALGISLRCGRPVLLTDDALTIAFPPAHAFHRGQCEEPARRAALEAALEAVHGRKMAARFETSAPVEGGAGDADPEADAARARAAAAAAADRLRHDEVEEIRRTPVVQALEHVFDAKLVRVGRKAVEPPPGATEEGTE